MTTIIVNGMEQRLDVDPSTPLLWVLREDLELTGTKFGCGLPSAVRAVHVAGNPIRSCVTRLPQWLGRRSLLLKGLATGPNPAHPQQVWIDNGCPSVVANPVN